MSSATLDQLLYLQGFMPVLQCVLTAKYKMPGLTLNTGAGVVTPETIDALVPLIERRHSLVSLHLLPLRWRGSSFVQFMDAATCDPHEKPRLPRNLRSLNRNSRWHCRLAPLTTRYRVWRPTLT